MTKHYKLEGVVREGKGKGAARAIRRENKIPSVIYGDGKEPINIILPTKEASLEYKRGHMFTTLCDLKVDGKEHLVLARDVQLHPVTDNVLHIDFLRVTSKTRIVVEVPVNLINEDKSPGIKENGVLNIVRHKIELLCSATDIPDHIDVNMEGKEIGDSVNISDAALPAGAKPTIEDRDFTIATIVAPRSLEALDALDDEVEEAEFPGEEGEEGEVAEGEEGATEEGGEEKAEEASEE